MVASDDSVRRVRVIAISPSDVMAERERLAVVVDDLNRRLAPHLGYQLQLWRWETDAYPGLHLEGPQGLIDQKMRIEDSHVVIGIFWTRFGTPTQDAGSGTEHELRRAWSAWREKKRPEVMAYFCERKSRATSVAHAAQMHGLLSFRESMPKHQMWWTYLKPVDFERAVRRALTGYILDLAQSATATDPSSTSVGTVKAPLTSPSLADVVTDPVARRVLGALLKPPNRDWKFRTADALAEQTGVPIQNVRSILHAHPALVRQSGLPDRSGRPLFAARPALRALYEGSLGSR